MSLEKRIEEFLLERGALKVGIATVESLAGGPPSTDLTYRMKEARSAISFALPLNREAIRLFFAKTDRVPHETDNLSTNVRSKELSWELAEMLKREGHDAKGCAANIKYRTEIPGWQVLMHPDISHRYLAVRSGVGSFGWSGNVGIKGVGTAIILGSTVTAADLAPTEPIPEDQGFCDQCKLCLTTCAADMVERDRAVSVTIGGKTFSHGARKSIILCDFVCGGFSGLHPSGKWSTWSPGRFRIPDYRDNDLLFKEFLRAHSCYAARPAMPGGYIHPALGQSRTYMTCGNCQIACFGDRKETADNVKLLHRSGCVVQRPDGSLQVLPPDQAAAEFEKMEPARKSLYC